MLATIGQTKQQQYYLLQVFENPLVTKVALNILGKEGYAICLYENGSPTMLKGSRIPSPVQISVANEKEMDALELLRYVRSHFTPGFPLLVQLRTL